MSEDLLATTTTETTQPPQPGQEEEEWDEEGDYDDEDDGDIDAEAEEIARRLGAELWADITKVNAARAAAPVASTDPNQNQAAEGHSLPPPPPIDRAVKEATALATVRTVLSLVEGDILARTTLSCALIPECDKSVLDLLQHINSSGTIHKTDALPLSRILMFLTRSEALFGHLPSADSAQSQQTDKGKRKRDEIEEPVHPNDPRSQKRVHLQDSDLQNTVTNAVQVIANTLAASPAQGLDSAVVSSIRLQLHQVFLFAVTSSAGGGRENNALQEISGLIQVIGVLSGIQIGQLPEGHDAEPPNSASPYPWGQSPQSTDIGTAIYPCNIGGCFKTFSRLFNLRNHQRVHTSGRPFRCSQCPASFARNHDLKRHLKLHDKRAYRCGGCEKVFSRKDAIKRHKDGSKNKGPKNQACFDGEVIEVELSDEDEDESVAREERRAKLWNEIASSDVGPSGSGAVVAGYMDETGPEEGEIHPVVISTIQNSIMTLHGLLQMHVGSALGTSQYHPMAPPMDPAHGQATLASVIARAQMQNMPSNGQIPVGSTMDQLLPPPVSAVATAVPDGNDPASSLSMYGLSDEQAKLLEIAIANAAAAAQAQAEAEAALEEGDEDEDGDDDDMEEVT